MNENRLQVERLFDSRLHLHDGPIDLIVGAFGEDCEVELAYTAAIRRFSTILDELCTELPQLRRRSRPGSSVMQGAVASRMEQAVAPFAAEHFITPMAAVAGAVAEAVISAMNSGSDVSRAYVNNGGDIALHLTGGASFVVGMIERPDRPSLFGSLTIHAADSVRGVATSGWRGRSFSLGIADAVTVLADCASEADAAATILANAVNLPGHAAIERIPANQISADSDLGDLPVTRSVGPLSQREIHAALDAGMEQAARLRDHGLIRAAALRLQGETRILGADRTPTMISMCTNDRSLIHA